MRTAQQCLIKAAEMKHAVDSYASMAVSYEKAAASWRHIALQAEWQDGFDAPLDRSGDLQAAG
jgi:hypothetical protein